ncbi:MAG: FAD-dependent oxidoreductase [Proteobacteria bacterium]|nr:FAD-dependent oxidoreductase [Pseudomonadota bacterium]
MRSHAKIVIVGGGIIGCSTAYHLSLMGEEDVVLIEKDELTSGSTWHAAGLVGQLRSSRNVTKMLKYSVELYEKLEKETEQNTGFNPVGGLRIASSDERWDELKASASMAKTFGLPMDMHSPDEAMKLFPPMIKDNIIGAANLPTDGYAEPSGITMALIKGARNRGITVYTHNRVMGMKLLNNGKFEIKTQKGTITADYFLNCAGNWAYELGQMLNVNIPVQPMEHQYMVTKKIDGIGRGIATMRDPDNLCYYKEENGGLIMGGYEHQPVVWADEGVPENFGQQLLAPDYEQFEQITEPCLKRTPCIEEAGIVKLINGPEAFTPDGDPIMGEVPEIKNYFVAAGFNAFGIAAGGGAGKMMAEWILDGAPSMDLWVLDVLRYGKYHHSRDYVRDRTKESYAHHYAMSWPDEEFESCRPLRMSPLYQRLKDQGCVFGAKYGWERPNWFAPEGVEPKDHYTFGRPNWFDHVGNECRTIREKVALIDQSSFSKFEVIGTGSLDFLQKIACNQIDKPIGTIIYTQMLTEKGGIACDLTITRVEKYKFYITTGTAFENHDLYWMNRFLPADGSVFVNTITSSRGTLNLCGPLSRKVLESVTRDDVSNGGFPYLTAREIKIGYAPVLAMRVTYVGELGWELHIPTEYTSYVYNKLWDAGQSFGMINSGYRAIESLRLEKGYRYWSGDITPDYIPYEAGLGFCVKLDKGDFNGKEALIKRKEEGMKIKLCTITVDDPEAVAIGKEAVMIGDKVIANVTSAGYGHTLNKTILYAYLPLEYSRPGTELTVEMKLEKFKGIVQKNTIFDPKNEKVKV